MGAREVMSITYSKGIMEQIRDNPTEAPHILEEFREELNKGLWEQLDNNYKREFTVMTGARGYQLFQDHLQRTALLEILKDMNEHFTPKEMVRMREMIESDDKENMRVASAIIDVKLKGKV